MTKIPLCGLYLLPKISLEVSRMVKNDKYAHTHKYALLSLAVFYFNNTGMLIILDREYSK